MKKLLVPLSLIAAALIIFVACRKNEKVLDVEKEIKSEFSVANVKEWYFGVFKKSSKFTELDEESPNTIIYRNSAMGNNPLIKAPNWNKSTYYKNGSYEFIEMPLVYNYKANILQKVDNISVIDRHRIIQSSIDKVLFIKDKTGKIEVRIMSIQPTYDYALSKNFDISNIHSNAFDPNFAGTIQVRKWNEKIVRTNEVAAGKLVRKIKEFKILRKNSVVTSSANSSQENCECGDHPEVIWVHQCTPDNYFQGDVMVAVACTDHGQLNTAETIYVCNDPCSGDGIGGEDGPCSVAGGIPPEQYDACICAYYGGANCDNGDDNGDDDGDDDENACTTSADECIGNNGIEVSEKIGGNVASSYDSTKTVYLPWIFFKGQSLSSITKWKLLSEEIAVITRPMIQSNNNNWYFESIAHSKDEIDGSITCGDVSYEIKSITPNKTYTYATMKLGYNVKTIFDCGTINRTKYYSNKTSTCGWTANEAATY